MSSKKGVNGVHDQASVNSGEGIKCRMTQEARVERVSETTDRSKTEVSVHVKTNMVGETDAS